MYASPTTTADACPCCQQPLGLEPYVSRVPIPGRAALGYAHPLCGLAWTREHARSRAIHALQQLADAIRDRAPDLTLTVDEAELVLTVAMGAALGEVQDRVTVAPGSDLDGSLRYWWLSPRPSIHPEPPQMRAGALCSLPRSAAATVEHRLILGITPAAP